MKLSEIKKLIKEEIELANTKPKQYSADDVYYIEQNIPKIIKYLDSLNISTPEHIDRKNRLIKIYKIISKKFN